MAAGRFGSRQRAPCPRDSTRPAVPTGARAPRLRPSSVLDQLVDVAVAQGGHVEMAADTHSERARVRDVQASGTVSGRAGRVRDEAPDLAVGIVAVDIAAVQEA